MKTNLSITSCLLGFLLTFTCLQTSCFASPAADSTHRILQETLKHKYGFVKEYIGDDKSLRFVAEYKGSDNSFRTSSIIKNIETAITFHDKNTFRIKVYDHDQKRWEIPEQYPYAHFRSQETISAEESCCTVQVTKDPYFAFVVTRKDTGETLFDSRNREFLFSDLYIELSTALPTDNVYGFGERNYKFKLTPGTYTIWGRDDAKIEEDGYGGGNTYSQHPVGLFKDKTGNFFMTLMRNSNAMDVIVESELGLTYKMVGGIIDLLFFVGDSYPDTVLKSYHNYLGNFTMMPFWSMGFHQSKWGYTSHAQMEDVVTKYDSNDVPLDVIWSDIDYMIDKEIFTVNTRLYPLDRMRELTTKHKKKWVPIIDPGVRITNPQGPGYREGLNQGVFLKNYEGNILSGYVWPGRVYFPDMLHPNTEKWWGDMLEVLHKMIPFAGIWLDMNEVANFVDGEEHRYSANKYDQIPYTPGRNPLKRKTISLDAVHYGDVKEYDAHGLFSLLECQATHKFLQSKSKLPFILTRSTSMGVGRFSAHWGGDNGATWQFLKESIAGNFNFQIFGIPFSGADICGFMDDTNEELCARWTQLGAWYPFARNHHEEKTRHQEPWTFTGNNLGVTVLETVRIALKTRYSMLKWYYSLFVETGGAGSIFKPLYFEFPQDQELYKDGFSDWEFMLGKGVLCTPKVEQGEPHVEAYFPNATWFDLFKGQKFIGQDTIYRTKRVQTPFNAPVPMFLRAGHIVHRQKVDHVLTTADLNNEYELIVALEKDANSEILTANGFMMGIKSFDDDSVYDRCMQDNCLYDVAVKVNVEDLSSAKVEVSIKRQKRDAKVPLDSFGLYELKLFGMPLNFMDEDEVKEGFAILELERDGKTAHESLAQLSSLEANAFVINFEEVLEIQDGDVLRFELLI